MRRRRSAGLTYFFLRREVVADRRDEDRCDPDAVFFVEAVCFPEDVPGFLPEDVSALLDLCFAVVESEDCVSYRFPSIGAGTTNKTQSKTANQRDAPTGRVAASLPGGEKTGFIVSM